MMTNFDCSTMWMKNCYQVADAFNVDPLYLQHKHDNEVIDFRHLQIPLGRKFRSLKLWFVFRLLGVKAIQENVRKVSFVTIFHNHAFTCVVPSVSVCLGFI